MILRRIADAIREQNWFTVVIEFTLVVAGVLVALQLDNWNQERQNRAIERAALAALLAEAKDAVAYITQEHQSMKNRVDAQHALMRVLTAETPAPEDMAVATLGYMSFEFFPSITPVRAAHDELAAAGHLQLIRSAEARRAVALYYAALGHFDGQLTYFRRFSTTSGYYIPTLGKNYALNVYTPDHPVAREIELDIDAMRRDPQFVSTLVAKLRNQMVMQGNRQTLLTAAIHMCETLAKGVDGTCLPEPSRQTVGQTQ